MGMSDREKLIELIGEIQTYGRDNSNISVVCKTSNETLADHLISNGVTFATDNNDGGKWIPVTERLPGTEDSYLVYTERGSVYTSHFYTEKRFASGYVREASWSQRGKVKVTHWMPLPEPPKEGE